MSSVDLRTILTADPRQPQWIVPDILPRGQLVILAGEPGVGKSLLSYHLAFAAASGLPFLGFPTMPTNVLYFDEENSLPDFSQYCQWVWRGLGCPPVEALAQRLHIEHLSLVDQWKQRMLSRVKIVHPGLLVVDTATPAFSILEENDNSEANRVIRALRQIQAESANDTSILVLKHQKETEDHHRKTIRGAKTWLGAFDSVWFHARMPGKPRGDGLVCTRLEPSKSRAWGLRVPIRIAPRWTGEEPRGLILEGSWIIPHAPKSQGN